VILSDQYDGSASPLEGDRTIMWRSLPVGAQLSSATITVTPVAAPGGSLFEEIISFSGNLGSYGATKDRGSTFVEIDFHKRRTLAAITGYQLVGAPLQVDLGGLYVEINDKGAIKSPGDILFTVGNDGLLPGLTVGKFKLTGVDPNVDSVTIRSVPTNFSVRFGDLRPFWAITGELSTSATSPDFSSVLQKLLTSAKVENGFYLVPFVFHSDTLARLEIEIDVEFVNQTTLLPSGVSEAVLPFDFATVQNASARVLKIDLPAGAHILPGQTTARIVGAFADTRIVPGLGLPAGVPSPPATVSVSADESQAQSISPSCSFPAVSIDLLLGAVSPSAQLSLDLRSDFNGRPDAESLLSEPVRFTVTHNPKKNVDWVNVPLPQPFNFEARLTYWLVLMSVEGNCVWSVQGLSTVDCCDKPSVQHTLDGGLSWHQAGALNASGLLAASFRLRTKPDRFQMPIQLRVGSVTSAAEQSPATVPFVSMGFDRYQPLGRVDLVLNGPDLSDTFNQYLKEGTPPSLPQGEHLANGDFENWSAVGNDIGRPFELTPDDATPAAFAIAPDGRTVYLAVERHGEFQILIIDTLCRLTRERIRLKTGSSPLAMTVHPSGKRAYILTSSSLHVVDLTAFVELGNGLTAYHFLEAIELPFEVSELGRIEFVSNLALSPDGSRLYLTLPGLVTSIGTAALESSNMGLRRLTRQDAQWLLVSSSPVTITLTPDGSRLFLTAPDSVEIRILDTTSFALETDAVVLEDQPVSIDFTPDAAVAMVATSGNNSITLIDTNDGLVIEAASLPGTPLALAVSPGGDRCYVVVAALSKDYPFFTPDWPELITLGTWTVATLPLNAISAVIAVNPQGDLLFARIPDSSFNAIPIGTLTPANWSVTSGDPDKPVAVTPVCFPETSPLARGLEFGHRSDRGLVPNDAATGLSQVVAAVELCPFEFSFLAVADDSDNSVAELLWLDQDSNLLQKDSLPIQNQLGGSSEPLWRRSPRAVAGGRLRPLLHRARVTSPAGTAQVEVRFTIQEGVTALLSGVSLNASTQALVNGDLQALHAGVPTGWTLSPPIIRGASFVPSAANAMQFVNFSISAVDLIQAFKVGGDQQFTFELLGRVLSSESPAQTCIVEIRWLKTDGSAAASPAALTIPVAGFGRYSAAGTTSQMTAKADVHLQLPSGTALEISQILFKTLQSNSVSVTFVSEAPGELRVSNPVVAYDLAPVPPPAAPSYGLATPTSPGRDPQTADKTYCPACGRQLSIHSLRTKSVGVSRSSLIERCPHCGSELFRRSEGVSGRFPRLGSARSVAVETAAVGADATLSATELKRTRRPTRVLVRKDK
jgi:WD40 repeat protein